MNDSKKGINKINVRFFVYDYSTEDIIREVSEREFIEYDGVIEYERNSVFENGIRQICLTKVN